MSAPWRETPEGVLVVCRLTPKGGRDGIDGLATLPDGAPALACRVREAPEDGRANAALCRLIANAAGVPASRARLAAGGKSRVKYIALQGDAAAMAEKLSAECLSPRRR